MTRDDKLSNGVNNKLETEYLQAILNITKYNTECRS